MKKIPYKTDQNHPAIKAYVAAVKKGFQPDWTTNLVETSSKLVAKDQTSPPEARFAKGDQDWEKEFELLNSVVTEGEREFDLLNSAVTKEASLAFRISLHELVLKKAKDFISDLLAKEKYHLDGNCADCKRILEQEKEIARREERDRVIEEIEREVRKMAHRSNFKVGTAAFGYHYEICSYLSNIKTEALTNPNENHKHEPSGLGCLVNHIHRGACTKCLTCGEWYNPSEETK